MNVDEILDSLNKLSPADLERVRKHCAALAGIGPKNRIDLYEVSADWILDGIKWELNTRGLSRIIPPDFHIRKKSQFHGYFEKSLQIRKLFESAVPRASKQDFILLGRMCAGMLARRVEQFAPVTLNTMIYNVGLIPDAFDEAFPRYIAGKMLPFLISSFREKSNGIAIQRS